MSKRHGTTIVLLFLLCFEYLRRHQGQPVTPQRHHATAVDAPLLYDRHSGLLPHLEVVTNHASSQRAFNWQEEEDVVTPSDLGWRAGGLVGPSEGQVLRWMSELYDSVATPAARAHVCERSGGKATEELLGTITEALKKQSSSRNDDCRVHLPAHERALCFAAALASNNSETLAGADGFRLSLCRSLAPCAQWVRGRFSVSLSAELLNRVYITRVKEKVLSQRQAFTAHQRQFLHGEVADATDATPIVKTSQQPVKPRHRGPTPNHLNLHEMSWLFHRTASIEKFNTLSESVLRRITGKLHSSRGGLSTDASLIFQGTGVSVVEDLQDTKVVFMKNETLASPPLNFLTPLEMLAALHHEVTADDGDDSLINLIVFYGDSTTREVFTTLVHTIRYGFDRESLLNFPDGAAKRDGHRFSYFSFFSYRILYDMVYRVFSTHDELLFFHSTQSPTVESRWSVEFLLREMIALRRAHDERRKRSAAGGDRSENNLPELPLLVVVWYWDPFSYRPRRVMDLMPNRPPSARCLGIERSQQSGSLVMPTVECQRSLSELNVTVRVGVSGALHWERRFGPPYLRNFGPRYNGGGMPIAPHHGSLYVLTSFPMDLVAASAPSASPLQTLAIRTVRTDTPSVGRKLSSSRSCGEHCLGERVLRMCRGSLSLFDTNRYAMYSQIYSVFDPQLDAARPGSRDYVAMTARRKDTFEMTPKECKFSVIGKNVLLLQWIEHNSVLRYRTTTNSSDIPEGYVASANAVTEWLLQQPTNDTLPTFVWKSMAVLDKGKMKHLPKFDLGDKLHFSSHGYPSDVLKGWAHAPIATLLAPRFLHISENTSALIVRSARFMGDENFIVVESLKGNESEIAAAEVQKREVIEKHRERFKALGDVIRENPNKHLRRYCNGTLSSFEYVRLMTRSRSLFQFLWGRGEALDEAPAGYDAFEDLLRVAGVQNASLLAGGTPLAHFALRKESLAAVGPQGKGSVWFHHWRTVPVVKNFKGGTLPEVTIQPTSFAKDIIETAGFQLQNRGDQLTLQLLLMDIVLKRT